MEKQNQSDHTGNRPKGRKHRPRVQKENFQFLSKDGRTKIHAIKWFPLNVRIRAVVQITHGMVEYIERYDEFACFMAERGFFVVGHDHLGHGASVRSEKEWGYFARKNPSETVEADMYQLTCMIQREYPDIPYFIFGHSMGSFLLRRYLTDHSGAVSGAIICGTGSMPELAVRAGMAVCRGLELIFGEYHRSRFVTGLCFGKAYKKFEKDKSDETNSWLSKNKESVQAYNKDKRCTFVFTVNGYYGLFSTVSYDNQMKNVRRIRKDLPVLFVSGEEDPVGSFGKGVRKACMQYRRAGIRDVKLKLYPNDRHEILQETDRKQVFADIYHWCVKHMAADGNPYGTKRNRTNYSI